MPLPQETIAWLHQAARLGQAGALADLDAIARLDALEARVALLEHVEADDDEPQTLHSVALRMVDTLEQLGVIPEIRGTLRRAILEPMEPAAAAAAPVATDDELTRVFDTYHLWRDSRRAIYNLGRQHGTPAAAPEPIEPEAQPAEDAAPAGGLVERIAFTAGCGNGTARAVILEVAGWLDRRGQHGCSLWLREQCAASQEGQANG